MPQQTVYIYNSTDGVLAWPGPLPLNQAREFIREFPAREDPPVQVFTSRDFKRLTVVRIAELRRKGIRSQVIDLEKLLSEPHSKRCVHQQGSRA